MTFKEFCKLFLIYAVLVILGTVLYVASFHTPLFAGMDVFFYRGLALILFWGAVMAFVMFLLKVCKWKKLITGRDILLLFAGFCCVNVVIFTHLPVTAERSISVFMLGYMTDHAEESFTEEEIGAYFVDRYVGDFGAFSKRFHEQEVTGTIEKDADGEGYHITESGKKLMGLYDAVADWYGLDKKLIHPDEAK